MQRCHLEQCQYTFRSDVLGDFVRGLQVHLLLGQFLHTVGRGIVQRRIFLGMQRRCVQNSVLGFMSSIRIIRIGISDVHGFIRTLDTSGVFGNWHALSPKWRRHGSDHRYVVRQVQDDSYVCKLHRHRGRLHRSQREHDHLQI